MKRLLAIFLVLLLCLSSLGACTAKGNGVEETESSAADASTPSGSSAGDSADPDEMAVDVALPPAPGFHLDFSTELPVKDSGEAPPSSEASPFLLTDAAHRLNFEDGVLRIEGNRVAQPKSTFSLVFAEMDMTQRPTVSLAVRVDRDTNLNLALEDADGKRAFVLGAPVHLILGGKPFVVHTFGFEALEGVDLKRITAIRFAINPDGPDYDGTLWLDDLRVGGMALPAPEMTGVADRSVVTGVEPFLVRLHDLRTHAGKSDPALTLEARSDNPDLLPDPVVTKDGLTLSPVSGKTGAATITLRFTEQGLPGIKEEWFRVEIGHNRAPSLFVPEYIDLEANGKLTIPVQAIDDGNPETRQALRILVKSDNPSLIPDPVLIHQGDDRWGELQITPVPGATGEANIRLTVVDDGGTTDGGEDRFETSVRVRIFEQLNQPPRMDPVRGVVWTEGQEEQRLVLTGLDDGDADIRQGLTVRASTDNPELLPEPTISAIRDGKATLRFRPTPAMTGNTEITVVLSDDGGTPENNGDAETIMQIPVEIRARPVTGFQDDFNDGVTDPVWLTSGEGAHHSEEVDGALRIDVDKFATNNKWAGLWFSLPAEMDLSRNPRIRLRMKTDKPAEMLIFLWDAKDVYNTAKTVRHVVGDGYVAYDFDFTGLLKSDKGEEVDLSRIKALLINFAPGMLYKGTWWFEEIAVGDKAPPVSGQIAAGTGASDADSIAAGVVLDEARKAALLSKPLLLSEISSKNGFAAQVTVDPTQWYQEMDGFGAFLGSGTVAGSMQDLMLPKVVDIGMSMARFGVIDTEFEPVNDNADPYATDYDAFNLEALPLEWMRTLRTSSGIEKFIVTMWSPPSWMKANRTLNSFYEAYNNKLEPRYYEEYAEHLVALVKTVKEHTGINLYAISLQNEPQFNEPYASCVINPEEYRDLLRVVGPRFREDGLPTRFFLPEALPQQKAIDKYIRTIAEDPVASEFMDLMAIHNYDADGIKVGGPGASEWADMFAWAQEKRPTNTWMTETSGHADDWSGAETLAGNIYNALKSGNASAWIFWSFNVTPDAAKYGLLKNGEETARYAVSKQYYKTIRPGMIRVEASSDQEDLLVLAFQDETALPQQVRTLILINRSDLPCVTSLKGVSDDTRLPEKWSAMVTTAERFAVDGGAVRNGIVILPPHSVVSLVVVE